MMGVLLDDDVLHGTGCKIAERMLAAGSSQYRYHVVVLMCRNLRLLSVRTYIAGEAYYVVTLRVRRYPACIVPE